MVSGITTFGRNRTDWKCVSIITRCGFTLYFYLSLFITEKYLIKTDRIEFYRECIMNVKIKN